MQQQQLPISHPLVLQHRSCSAGRDVSVSPRPHSPCWCCALLWSRGRLHLWHKFSSALCSGTAAILSPDNPVYQWLKLAVNRSEPAQAVPCSRPQPLGTGFLTHQRRNIPYFSPNWFNFCGQSLIPLLRPSTETPVAGFNGFLTGLV